jgi:hypothetical protein
VSVLGAGAGAGVGACSRSGFPRGGGDLQKGRKIEGGSVVEGGSDGALKEGWTGVCKRVGGGGADFGEGEGNDEGRW